MKRPFVTDHALLRWMERVRGVDVPGFRRDLAAIEDRHPDGVADSHLVEWVLAAYEWDKRDVINEILSPLVIAGFNAGAGRALNQGHWVCFKAGKVTTVFKKGEMIRANRPGGLNSHAKNKNKRRRRTGKEAHQ